MRKLGIVIAIFCCVPILCGEVQARPTRLQLTPYLPSLSLSENFNYQTKDAISRMDTAICPKVVEGRRSENALEEAVYFDALAFCAYYSAGTQKLRAWDTLRLAAFSSSELINPQNPILLKALVIAYLVSDHEFIERWNRSVRSGIPCSIDNICKYTWSVNIQQKNFDFCSKFAWNELLAALSAGREDLIEYWFNATVISHVLGGEHQKGLTFVNSFKSLNISSSANLKHIRFWESALSQVVESDIGLLKLPKE